MKLRCVSTVYLPDDGGILERFEDATNPDEESSGSGIYEVPDSRVQEFLDTGCFEPV